VFKEDGNRVEDPVKCRNTGRLKKVSDEEVRYAMFSLKDIKTPRPDA
jgi:hypothetical protein